MYYNINDGLVLLIVMWCFCTTTLAQPANTSENYKKKYKKAQGFIYKYPDSTKFFATQALLAAQTNNQRGDVYSLLGKMAKTQEWFNTSVYYHQKALKLYPDEKNKNKARLNLVTPYRRLKKYNTALRMVRWVNRYLVEKNDLLNLKSSYSSLGNIFYNLSQVDTFSVKWADSSLYYHRRSINLRKKNFPETLAQAYYNASFAYEAISPDSAIYYTKLALEQGGISDYRKVLYNIRLAQINYKKEDYKEGLVCLDIAKKTPFSDLSLKNMYWYYQAMIALQVQDLPKTRKYFNKCDSLVALMSAKARNITDRKNMAEMIQGYYQDAFDVAQKLYKATNNKVYFELKEEYRKKKDKAGKKYRSAHQQIEQNDSLQLSKEDSSIAQNDTGQVSAKQQATEDKEHWLFLGIMATIITIIGAWWWWQVAKLPEQKDKESDNEQKATSSQKLNTNLLSSLASHNEYEKILALLEEHLGVNVIEQKAHENFTAQEKVYLALLAEGFTQWEIRQMLNLSKKNILDWEKQIKQKKRTA